MNKIKKFLNKHKMEIIIGSTGLIVGTLVTCKLTAYWYGRGFDLGQIFTVEWLRNSADCDIPLEVLEHHKDLCDKWIDLSDFMELIEKMREKA